MEEKKLREILPVQGFWTVADLAKYLGVTPATVQQRLSEAGITVLSFSHRYEHRLFRLEDLCGKK
jgi:Mn-dependent DtxR family transcriptional regulator